MQHSTLNNASAILQARREFLASGELQQGAVGEVIARSWRRCLAKGVDADAPRDLDVLATQELRQKREQHRVLLEYAQREMETLNEQISHKRSVVVLTDDQGLILHSLCGHQALSQQQRSSLMPGVSWHEDRRGTNAIGTALVEQSATSVWATEHFMSHHHAFSCSAVPIFDAQHKVMAVLDVSASTGLPIAAIPIQSSLQSSRLSMPKLSLASLGHESLAQETLALVKMAALSIENRLFFVNNPGEITLHFHVRPEFVDTLWEGIATFSSDGQLLAVNRRALSQFQLDAYALTDGQPTIYFDQVFDMPFSEMLQHLDRRKQAYANADTGIKPLFALRLQNGSRLCARVESLHSAAKSSLLTGSVVSGSGISNSAALLADGTRKLDSPGKHSSDKHSLDKDSLDKLNSGDMHIARAVQQIKQVVMRDISILIQGETGVGKELFARAIHQAGPRRDGPWVAVNCAAIPEGLIEAELFGYEEGAFTGAKRKGSMGKIEQADGGTLFLDEIGDMPLPLQARLLRVLQERSITPLGGSALKRVNFSLLSASNRKLRVSVEHGEFRSDLYYRINGLTVNLPPLRLRSDLHCLVQNLLQMEQADATEITPAVMALFESHPWPGNIRQLHNVLKTALALAENGPIDTWHLTEDFLEDVLPKVLPKFRPKDQPNEGTAKTGDHATGAHGILQRYMTGDGLADVASGAIRSAMQQHAGNISAAARQLGISRNTLYRKLKAMNLA